MKRLLFVIFALFLIKSGFAQSAKDVNMVIQKTIDLHSLQDHYTEEEKKGFTPLIIIDDEKIPDNLIIFKFNKRVKILTESELKTFKEMYSGNLDSYFVFEELDITENKAEIYARFRKNDKLPIKVNLEKREGTWYVTDSNVGKG